MTKTLLAAFALALTLSALVPVLLVDQPANAGSCERVYTSSGWVTRCK
ncbi:MAG: hypothetical protein JWN07_2975 [Hyphomicrobiales bacterium]|nr:hypothetical protein [Hyphomicrobiales bacterium]